MAFLGEAHGEEGGAWYAREVLHKEERSEAGRTLSLMRTFNVKFSDLESHPKLKYTDDCCTHYQDKEGRHYWFNRSDAKWSRE